MRGEDQKRSLIHLQREVQNPMERMQHCMEKLTRLSSCATPWNRPDAVDCAAVSCSVVELYPMKQAGVSLRCFIEVALSSLVKREKKEPREVPVSVSQGGEDHRVLPNSAGGGPGRGAPKWVKENYRCRERGHLVAECHKEVVLLCTELLKRKRFSTIGVVVERFCEDVILDTASNRSMERRRLVPEYLILSEQDATLRQVLTREKKQAGKGMIDYPDVVKKKFQDESVT